MFSVILSDGINILYLDKSQFSNNLGNRWFSNLIFLNAYKHPKMEIFKHVKT